MANILERLPENSAGEFFVDASCIDCDTCRQVAPGVFTREDRVGMSVVARQPAAGEVERALMALVACPTSSIGTVHKQAVINGPAQVRYGRTTPFPLSDVIENLDVVKAALAGTEFMWMTEE